MEVNEFVIKMVDPKGFDEAFEKALQAGLSHKDAYHICNVMYEKTFGDSRYSSYDSYRLSRRKRIKKT